MKKPILILTAATILYFMTTKSAFAKPTSNFIIRGQDSFGSGAFGATRGDKIHQGEDYLIKPGETVFAPMSGTVTRFPFPYGSDLSFTGIEIKNDLYDMKIFYMSASVAIGTKLQAGQPIGKAQNIAGKYGSGMGNHIHIEVRNKQGKLLQFSKLI